MELKRAGDEFIIGYFSTHDRGKKTKAAYRTDLTQFIAYAGESTHLTSVDGLTIERWAAQLRDDGYSPATIRRKMVALRVFCSYWMRKGLLSDSPFWRVKLSFGRIEPLPRTLTDAEIRSLLVQARYNCPGIRDGGSDNGAVTAQPIPASSRTYRELRNSALLEILFATGMRVGEVSSLDIQDFMVKEAVFKVKGKGGRHRLAFVVDDETIRVQRAHLGARMRIKSKSLALFLNVSGERLSTQGIANVLSQLCLEAGINRHITPHMLRHTVATLLLRNGVDIRIVQEFLGHASIATTQRYTHITKEHLIGILRKLHPSLNFRFSS